jgi:hypothetical protein
MVSSLAQGYRSSRGTKHVRHKKSSRSSRNVIGIRSQRSGCFAGILVGMADLQRSGFVPRLICAHFVGKLYLNQSSIETAGKSRGNCFSIFS